MDGFTQGALGAAAAQVVYGKRLGRWALPIGWAAGMLADADLFVTNSADPLWGWTFHRSMTHALAFVPIGALIACVPFLLAPTLRSRWKELYGACFLAYLTHAPLDATTTYGTVLLWPFDDVRVSWDIMSIIDPVFTLLLLGGVIWSALRRSTAPARIGVALAGAYMALCALQHARAEAVQKRLVVARGHQVEAARVMPTLANAVLYRSLYRDDSGRLFADAVRVPLTGPATFRAGDSAPVFDPARERLLERAAAPERLRRDLDRFAWFSDRMWARTPGQPALVGDMRITADPARLAPLWGIIVAPADPNTPVQRGDGAGRDAIAIGELWREIIGDDPRHQPAP
ncbi:metal-dependent hydrolase [Haliangium sp.]|uniref:metal-dependent hydrolase n=1 Tax=Haliangium sp. TaxID=2663208 RepID=UPI003D0A7087